MAVIGIDASRANVEQRTGTEWYIFHLLQHFKRLIPNRHRVVLYSKEPLRPDFLPLPDTWEARVLNWPPKLLWTQLRLSIHLMRRSQRPDVLFIPAHTIPIVHPPRTVYVAHDIGFERHSELYANSYIGGPIVNALVRIGTLGRYSTSELDYHRWSMRFAVRHAKRIIAISDFTKSELQTFYHVPDRKVAVIHNGFSWEEYAPESKRGDVSVPGNSVIPTTPYILYIGRLEYKKNISRLIEAFALMKTQFNLPHVLCLAGFPGYGYDQIQAVIQTHHIKDQIIELGYVPQDQLGALMKRAAAFVFPTHYEGFGIPVLEAMASGVPVACSDIPPLREVGGSAAYYFNHTQPADIAKVLHQVLTLSTEERSLYDERAHTQVAKFSWQQCANETWQVLASLVE